MSAQFVNRSETHHAFRHLGLDRSVRIQRIGHSIDDARFEHRHRRLILDRRRLAGSRASLKVDGVRAARRCGGASAGRARSDFGQASSKVAGGGSSISTPAPPVRNEARRPARIACTRLGSLAFSAGRRGEHQIAPRFGRAARVAAATTLPGGDDHAAPSLRARAGGGPPDRVVLAISVSPERRATDLQCRQSVAALAVALRPVEGRNRS